ncbi:glutamyl-tRNA reductase [Pontiellaceae bacterium B1224]|nr:glutamyl-tRNA reductase [Pontiellaceae bacterium B1224]
MEPSSFALDSRFFVAGVNYRTAPVQVRERMAIAHPDRIEVSRMLQLKAGLSEVVVLWTCNRVEIYGVVSRGAGPDLNSIFACLAREMPDLSAHVYCHQGEDALKHLFTVASGLDSMVLGETQITGQVKDAYEAAREAKLVGKVLNSVFQTALRTAKAVRTQTSIGQGARSVGGVAVAHAREVLGTTGLNKHSVLMIGAGEMASCCLLHLQKKGECAVVVANRSIERAEKLADEFHGTAVPFDQMFEAMKKADVVISSTGSSETVINGADVEAVMQSRKDHPLVLIDIAVPRDIDPEAGKIDGVHLHDIDALETSVQQTMGRWEKDLAVCEEIVEREMENLQLQFERRAVAQNAYHDRAAVAQAV